MLAIRAPEHALPHHERLKECNVSFISVTFRNLGKSGDRLWLRAQWPQWPTPPASRLYRGEGTVPNEKASVKIRTARSANKIQILRRRIAEEACTGVEIDQKKIMLTDPTN